MSSRADHIAEIERRTAELEEAAAALTRRVLRIVDALERRHREAGEDGRN
jgi:hypothetical protein